MMRYNEIQLLIQDDEPDLATYHAEVLFGMRLSQKRLPSKYFYDERGCQLFEEICALDEYYLTRTELSIMEACARDMGRAMGPACMLVEFGSGRSIKTRLLLDEMASPVAYVPVDIARDHLEQTAFELSQEYAGLAVLPVCADFTEAFELPGCSVPIRRKVVYFPGSTIGNLEQLEVQALLRRIGDLCGAGGGLLIGLDLQKEIAMLEAAYNDRKGVTAQFNLNLLARLNQELGADFQLGQYEHLAVYNKEQQRIEMHLVSLNDQSVSISDETFQIGEGESICTEYSHKYNLDQFSELSAECGLVVERTWRDQDQLFAVVYLSVP